MSAMRKFLQSLSGEPAPKPQPKERIDIFKALINDLELTVRHEVHRRGDNVLIPSMLNKMIQLLLEEEREAEAMQEGTAPCVEFFLQSRILERMCIMASANKPAGMFQWIINAIARIIQHMKSPLLAHSSMHKPLVRLLSAKPYKLTFEEKIEILKLISSLAHRLKEAPIFVKLFWSTTTTFPKQHEQSTSPTLSSSPASSPIVTSPLQAQEKVSSIPTLNKKHFVLFKILDRIYRGSSNDRRLAEQVRRCILSCIVIDDHYNELQAYLAHQVKFLTHTANELGKLYATLSRETYNGNPNANGYLQEYFRQLQFCAALCKIDFNRLDSNPPGGRSSNSPTPPPPVVHTPEELGEFSRTIAAKMKELFFIPILRPGLLSDDPKLANIHTIFARETLLQLDAPELMGALIECLVGPSEPHPDDANGGIFFGDAPEDPLREPSGHTVQETLISRIEYRAYTYPMDANTKKVALLSANTMRLFSTLFQFHPHNMYVTHHLLFRNLPLVANPNAHWRGFRHPTEQEEMKPETYHHALDPNYPLHPDVLVARQAVESLPEDPPNLGLRFEMLLDYAPLARQNRDSNARPDVQTYHDYTKLRFKIARPNMLLWSSYPLSPEHVYPPPFIPEKKLDYGGLHSLWSGNKVLESEATVADPQEVATWRILPPLPKDHSPGKPVVPRRFLRYLLTNLEHFLELPLDFALYLTDTLSSIAQYPHLYIHKWLYSDPIEPNQSPKSLFGILQQLSTKSLSFLNESPTHIAKVIQFKEMAEKKDAQEGQLDSSEEQRTTQNIVLLDEFCKEILAILLLIDQVLN